MSVAIAASQMQAKLLARVKVDKYYATYVRYLSDRRQYVKIGQHSSGLFDCSSGVPQCSVLGPLLFAVYVSPVGNVIESFGVRHQQYADDTQLYLSM